MIHTNLRSGFVLLFCVFAVANVYSQSQAQLDSLMVVMCKDLNSPSGELEDKMRIALSFVNAERFAMQEDLEADQKELLFEKLWYQLQKVCPEFKRTLEKNEPPTGDWSVVVGEPENRINESTCLEVFNYKEVWYQNAPNEDFVSVKISKRKWNEEFADGTYSKLKLEWDGDCRFHIEFIESNHDVRSKLSSPGDKYYYKLYDVFDGGYHIALDTKKEDRYYLFKLYTKQK